MPLYSDLFTSKAQVAGKGGSIWRNRTFRNRAGCMFSASHRVSHSKIMILLLFWRGGRCPVMSLMSLQVDAMSPSHVTVTNFFLWKKILALPPRKKGKVYTNLGMESARRGCNGGRLASRAVYYYRIRCMRPSAASVCGLKSGFWVDGFIETACLRVSAIAESSFLPSLRFKTPLENRKKRIQIYTVVFFSKIKDHTEDRYVD
jgi:hypothetical protein